jgi:hypothetical protein
MAAVRIDMFVSQHKYFRLSRRGRRYASRAGFLAVLAFVTYCVIVVYGWANGPNTVPVINNGPQNDVAIRLTDAPFTGVNAGRKTWSLWAAQIDVIRVPGVELASTQRAILTDIRDGKLYGVPGRDSPQEGSGAAAHSVAAVTRSPGKAESDKPIATFKADSGVYAVRELEAIPPEIALNFAVQWQFKLSGHVSFLSQSGDRMQSDRLTIFEMVSNRTHRLEQRVVFDNGATVTHKDARITANRARYSPRERSVECIDGVRSVTKDGWFQTDRLFWSLKDRTIFCPDTTSGENKGSRFTATSLSMDLAHRITRAGHILSRLKPESNADLPMRN